MSIDDDAEWADALAGRSTGASPGAREGAALRVALAQRRVEIPTEPAASPLQRQDALITRARQELRPARAESAWRRRGGWLALAASIAAVGIGLQLYSYFRTTPEELAVRSAEAGPVRIQAADPQKEQQALLAALRQSGITARGYEMLGRYGIDADLPSPVPPGLRALLARYRLSTPGDGVLRVEFVSPTPP
jgi:hypothetical protein